MMKGKRRTVVIKCEKIGAGCEIYVVSRGDRKTPEDGKNVTRDMVCEANRIIDEGFMIRRRKRLTPPLYALLFFTLGVIATVAIFKLF